MLRARRHNVLVEVARRRCTVSLWHERLARVEVMSWKVVYDLLVFQSVQLTWQLRESDGTRFAMTRWRRQLVQAMQLQVLTFKEARRTSH